jgi:hypothetical protein
MKFLQLHKQYSDESLVDLCIMNLKRRETNRLWLALRVYAKIYLERLRKLESELFDRGRNSRTNCRTQVERDYTSTAMMFGRLSESLNC